MNFLRRIGQWPRALEIFDSMPKQRADLVAYLAAFSAYKEALLWERALQTLQEALQVLPESVKVYNAVLSVCSTAARWAEALRVMEEMVVSPDEVSFALLLDACQTPGCEGQKDQKML